MDPNDTFDPATDHVFVIGRSGIDSEWATVVDDPSSVVLNGERAPRLVWNAGRRVYELIAPGGRTYVMQSYAQTPEHPQTLGGLRSLGRRLTLPAGWHFRSRVLRRALVLGVDVQATITRDTFENTYQLERR